MSLEQTLRELVAVSQRALAEYEADKITIVPAGGLLQPALDRGGVIKFYGVHEGPFFSRVTGTHLIGGDGTARIHGRGIANFALFVPPSSQLLKFESFQVTGDVSQALVLIGANDSSQNSLDKEPRAIHLERIIIPEFHGKRGFEVNAREWVFKDCEARNVYERTSSGSFDSVGFGVINSSGDGLVEGGFYEAASENIIMGGDINDMGVVPTNVTFRGITLSKPLAWRTADVGRVKNLFELKTGRNVVIEDCHMLNCWGASQAGYAVLFTPTRDGQLSGIVFRRNIIENVGGGFQIVGRASRYYTPGRTDVTVRDCRIHIDHTIYGGTGSLADILAEPQFIDFENNDVSQTGTKLVQYDFNQVMESNGTKREGGPMETFRMANNRSTIGKYGLMLDGFKPDGTTTAYQGGGANGEGLASSRSWQVEGNTFTGAVTSYMKRNFPANVYIT